MATFFNDIIAQMKGIWARLEGQQRLVVVAVTFATIVGLGGMVWFAGQPSYEVVYTAKTGEEIRQVQQALSQANVSFVMDDTGFSFKVERSKIGLANMAIAKEGLTGTQSLGIGGGSLIEDAATKQWRLDSASRAQAASAIQQLDGVMGVTVTASRPRRVVAFRDSQRQQRASATVVLKLAIGVPFDAVARSAASIASSQLMVPLENIDVVSTTGGQRWSYDPDRETGGGSSEFLAMQRNLSDEKTRLAQDRLDQLWPGKTAVQVAIELDPSWEVRTEKVLPSEPLISSEDFTKDSTDSPAAAEAAGSKSKNEQRTRKFVTEIGERRSGKMMPDVRRMSVAVLYDRSLESTEGFDKAGLEQIVKAMVGWDPNRDSAEAFSTLAGDFAPIQEEIAVSSGPGFGEMVTRWGPTIGQILGVIVVLMFLRGLFKRSSPPKVEDPIEPEVPEEDLAPEEQQKRMRREIERSIASDPAALAKMLEAWLMEQKA